MVGPAGRGVRVRPIYPRTRAAVSNKFVVNAEVNADLMTEAMAAVAVEDAAALSPRLPRPARESR
jgi:hypothetical protein